MRASLSFTLWGRAELLDSQDLFFSSLFCHILAVRPRACQGEVCKCEAKYVSEKIPMMSSLLCGLVIDIESASSYSLAERSLINHSDMVSS